MKLIRLAGHPTSSRMGSTPTLMVDLLPKAFKPQDPSRSHDSMQQTHIVKRFEAHQR